MRFWDDNELPNRPEEEFECEHGIHVCCLEATLLLDAEPNICQRWDIAPLSSVCDPLHTEDGIPIEGCCNSISYDDDIKFGPKVYDHEKIFLGRGIECGELKKQRAKKPDHDIMDYIRVLDGWGAKSIPVGDIIYELFQGASLGGATGNGP